MDERGTAVTIFISFLVTIAVIGFGYTVMHGVIGSLPAGPDTETMQFLTYAVTYIAIPALIIAVLWYLNKMESERGYD